MRRALSALVIAIGVAGCGASKPPEAPLSAAHETPKRRGAAALAPDIGAEADATITLDLAAIRANPLLARAASEADRESDLGTVLAKIDRIDLRAWYPRPPRRSALIAVVWGRLPKDPRDEKGIGLTFEEASSLPSGVREYAEQESLFRTHVFALNDGAWVVTAGAATDRVRDHYVSTATPPPPPSGDLVSIRANRAILGGSQHLKESIGEISKLEVTLTSDATSLRAVLGFEHAEDAKRAAGKVRMLTALLSIALASEKDCRAFEKITIDVKNDAKDVTVEVKGIGEALALWDDEKCSRSTHRK